MECIVTKEMINDGAFPEWAKEGIKTCSDGRWIVYAFSTLTTSFYYLKEGDIIFKGYFGHPACIGNINNN